MQLCSRLGWRTGLNTYGKMAEVLFHQQVDEAIANQAATQDANKAESDNNKLISNYLAKAKSARVGSSFFGPTGKVNLVATLLDIFMGGKTERTYGDFLPARCLSDKVSVLCNSNATRRCKS